MRRLAGIVAIAAGVMLIGFTIGAHVFSRAQDAQKIADAYRPLMSEQGLHDLRTGFEAVKASGAELGTQAEPALQQRLGLNDADFATYMQQTMPGIAAFDANAPTVVGIVDPVIGQMEAARADYHRADSIPTGNLSMTSAPWLFLGIGALLIGLGAFALWRPGRVANVGLAAIGLVLIVAPLVIGIPGKVDAAQRVTKLGEVGLAPATGQKAVGATKLFDDMAHDVRTKLTPALGGEASFGENYATLDAFARNWEGGISAQSHQLSDSQVALAPTFANANRLPIGPIPWLFIISGLVLTTVAAFQLRPARRPVAAPAPTGLSPAQ